MIRNLLIVFVVLQLGFSVANAQDFVSTEPSGRNAILEEFTGRNCGYCPDGHRISNEIAAENPGRFWAINIHAGSFAPTTYPNLKTNDGTAIHNYFSVDGYPSGVVNRISRNVSDRSAWRSQVNTILNETSVANIAAIGVINPITRIMHLEIEVYYTADGATDRNFVTAALLQSNILGPQADYGNFNPEQWVDGKYNHTHALRDIITATAGDTVNGTSQGSYHKFTYDYEIPEMIGNPNGVEVVLEDLEVVVFLSETKYNVITANKAQLFISEGEQAIAPYITKAQQKEASSCDNVISIQSEIFNIGTDDITSLTLLYEYGDISYTKQWTGSLAQYQATTIETSFPSANEKINANVTIMTANDTEVPFSENTYKSMDVEPNAGFMGQDDVITIKIWQDKYGNQITWKLFDSQDAIVAKGGPYSQLPSNNVRLQLANVNIAASDCYRFEIYDSNKDGINNGHGEGHYQIETSTGEILFSKDGTYTSSEVTNFFVATEPVNMVTVAPELFPKPEAGTIIGTGSFREGMNIILIAVPESGRNFVNWTLNDSVVSTEDIYTYTVMSGDKLVANFSIKEGIDDIAKESISVYPNPVENILHVKNVKDAEYITITDLYGKVMTSIPYTDAIDVSAFPKGLYILQVSTKNGMLTTKFVR